MTPIALIVLAKAPVPGRVKTRLCPPLSFEDAADVAGAALLDTLDAVAATDVRRRVLALDGVPGGWVTQFSVTPQRGAGLAERLAAAFDDVGGPALLIGMDTPQVTPALLAAAANLLLSPATDAVLGKAYDGGWWAIGLRRADPRVFLGVPMSRGDTGALQLQRLHELGLRTRPLPVLHDVDDFDTARLVARQAPSTRFATVVERLDRALTSAGLPR